MLVVFRKLLTSPLLLSIVWLVLPSAVTSSPWTASPRRAGPRTHIWGFQMDDDYENLTEETVSPPPPTPNPSVPHCQYNSCKDQQEPCLLMAASQGCSCPGISGPNELPEPPHLLRVWRQDSGGVLVHWCAPASTVTTYHVEVEGQDGWREVGERTRVLDLGEVPSGAEVCVRAVNGMGVSKGASHSCKRFELPNSNLALKLGIIGVAVALVVVLAIALVLWKLRPCRSARTEAGARGETL